MVRRFVEWGQRVLAGEGKIGSADLNLEANFGSRGFALAIEEAWAHFRKGGAQNGK
jgi:hypothetical protein